MLDLEGFQKVIISYHRSNKSPFLAPYFSKKQIDLIKAITEKHEVILDIFVNPYPLIDLENLSSIDALIVSYQNSPESQKISADLLNGNGSFIGSLPVGISEDYPVGSGINLSLGTENERVSLIEKGFDPDVISQINDLAEQVIDSAMTPGMQILIAKNDQIVFHKLSLIHI